VIIYQSTKSAFLADTEEQAIENVVATAYLAKMGHYAPQAEFRSWQNSLLHMADVLRDDELPDSMGVGIEFGIPATGKRIDFILSGETESNQPRAVIIELKQWSGARLTNKDGIIIARRGGRAEVEGPHPCYQAWSYAALLEGFNEAVQEGGVELQPCAYLHNYFADGTINHPYYAPYISKAPLFLRGNGERVRLRSFIKNHLKLGDNGALLRRIEQGRIRPSKMLADSLVKMLKGNQEFVLIDDQKLVYETALAKVCAAAPGRKEVVIVKGGPGTGKSVVAINLIVKLSQLGLLGKYVSKNAAPRAVYAQKLAGHRRKVEISAMFGGSGTFMDTEPDTYDALIVDEAHRLNEKSGLYGHLGENQIKELISSAKCTVMFVDDDQIVTLNDIGRSDVLEQWARRLDADVTQLELASQFRCGGSDGYLSWLDRTLGIRPTANESFDHGSFDFRVIDSPAELHSQIAERNRVGNRSRVVAGYCWDWNSKRDSSAYDIVIPEFDYMRRWNLDRGGDPWITATNSIDEVGCIHTCQGLELDYVGVIVGPDLLFRGGKLVPKPENRSRMDRSIRGYKGMMKTDPETTRQRVDSIIRNTYRTLMTRGLKGCYVYCCDKELGRMFRDASSG
jgi:uncharacterized protein